MPKFKLSTLLDSGASDSDGKYKPIYAENDENETEVNDNEDIESEEYSN